jgi:plasmid stabilization system protein ParE
VEKIKAFWKPRAVSHLKKQANWYAENMGTASADKFWNGMIKAGDLLGENPYLGKIEPVFNNSGRTYRSLIQHKDYKIIYFIENDRQIQIISIWCCSKGSPSI